MTDKESQNENGEQNRISQIDLKEFVNELDDRYERKPAKNNLDEIETDECGGCGAIIAASCKHCPECGVEFE